MIVFFYFEQVCVKGCKCDKGYILKEKYNICVKPEHCDIIIDPILTTPKP